MPKWLILPPLRAVRTEGSPRLRAGRKKLSCLEWRHQEETKLVKEYQEYSNIKTWAKKLYSPAAKMRIGYGDWGGARI